MRRAREDAPSKVHGGLLARRDLPSHLEALRENGIEFIDMVCVNLYPSARR